MMYYCPCIILCFIHILVIMCFCRRFKKSLASLIATFRKRLLACIFTKTEAVREDVAKSNYYVGLLLML